MDGDAREGVALAKHTHSSVVASIVVSEDEDVLQAFRSLGYIVLETTPVWYGLSGKSIVIEGRDTKDDRPVVIKLYRPDAIAEYLREYESLTPDWCEKGGSSGIATCAASEEAKLSNLGSSDSSRSATFHTPLKVPVVRLIAHHGPKEVGNYHDSGVLINDIAAISDQRFARWMVQLEKDMPHDADPARVRLPFLVLEAGLGTAHDYVVRNRDIYFKHKNDSGSTSSETNARAKGFKTAVRIVVASLISTCLQYHASNRVWMACSPRNLVLLRSTPTVTATATATATDHLQVSSSSSSAVACPATAESSSSRNETSSLALHPSFGSLNASCAMAKGRVLGTDGIAASDSQLSSLEPYLPPEFFRSRSKGLDYAVDETGDAWALGMSILSLATNSIMDYLKETRQANVGSLLPSEACMASSPWKTWIKQAKALLPTDVRDIMSKCLEYDPTKRPTSPQLCAMRAALLDNLAKGTHSASSPAKESPRKLERNEIGEDRKEAELQDQTRVSSVTTVFTLADDEELLPAFLDQGLCVPESARVWYGLSGKSIIILGATKDTGEKVAIKLFSPDSIHDFLKESHPLLSTQQQQLEHQPHQQLCGEDQKLSNLPQEQPGKTQTSMSSSFKPAPRFLRILSACGPSTDDNYHEAGMLVPHFASLTDPGLPRWLVQVEKDMPADADPERARFPYIVFEGGDSTAIDESCHLRINVRNSDELKAFHVSVACFLFSTIEHFYREKSVWLACSASNVLLKKLPNPVTTSSTNGDGGKPMTYAFSALNSSCAVPCFTNITKMKNLSPIGKYLPPEFFMHRRASTPYEASFETDVWALGLALLCLGSHDAPCKYLVESRQTDFGTLFSTTSSISEWPWKDWVAETRAGLPSALRDLMRKCLQFNPAKRPPITVIRTLLSAAQASADRLTSSSSGMASPAPSCCAIS